LALRLRGVPYIEPAALEAEAQRFLECYHPDMTCPVPIETIAEFALGLEVRPMPELYRTFGVDGYLSFDAQAIYVDQHQMESQETRYRFTLAHEIGHWLLHRDFYEDKGITDLESYLRVYASLDEADLKKWEFQARNLAGRILLPKRPFLTAVNDSLGVIRAKVEAGVGGKATDELLCKALAKAVAEAFNVHHDVAEIRLMRDGLCEDLGIPKPLRQYQT